MILVHGVNTTADWYANATKGLGLWWTQQNQVPQAIIEFRWGAKNYTPPNAAVAAAEKRATGEDLSEPSHVRTDEKWNRILMKQGGRGVNATDTVATMKKREDNESTYMWDAKNRLKEIIDELNREKSKLNSKEPITVIAHSQGTLLTLGALGDGAKIDTAIFMGSPYDPFGTGHKAINWRTTDDYSDIYAAAKNLRRLVSHWSRADKAASVKGGIGGKHGGPWLGEMKDHLRLLKYALETNKRCWRTEYRNGDRSRMSKEQVEKEPSFQKRVEPYQTNIDYLSSFLNKIESVEWAPGATLNGYNIGQHDTGHGGYMSSQEWFLRVHGHDVPIAGDQQLTEAKGTINDLRRKADDKWSEADIYVPPARTISEAVGRAAVQTSGSWEDYAPVPVR